MTWNTPNLLTLLRILLIPLFVVVYYLPYHWSNEAATAIFILAGFTDWLDGYLARRLGQHSRFGAFLDPVADKLMVAAALVMLLADERVHVLALDARVFAVMVLIIMGREIAVSRVFSFEEVISFCFRNGHSIFSFQSLSCLLGYPNSTIVSEGF